MRIFGRKKPILLGVDISSSAVKLLELSSIGGRYRVEGYAVEPLSPDSVIDRNITDVQSVGEAVARAVKKSGTRTRTAACAVSGTAVITKVISMPSGLSEEEIESQIQLEADQYIPYPLEEVRLDFAVLGPSESGADRVDILLAASRSDDVDVRVAALELGGLATKIVDVEIFALENAVNFMLQNNGIEVKGQTIVVADVGATVMNFTVLKDNRVIYTRDQSFGGKRLTEEIQRRYGLSYAEAGLAKRRGGLPDDYVPEVLDPFKESMALEVNRALQLFFSSGPLGAADRLVLAGGCASIPGMSELMESKTGLKATVASPFTNMAVSPSIRAETLSRDAPALMVPFGLALRSFD